MALTYEPLNTLKPVAADIWIVDGPVIQFRLWGLSFLKVPFSTRMTIVRLSDGGVFIHSPTELTDSLQAEVEALGPVRFIIAPNRIHHWWVPDWHKAFPEAEVFLAPRVAEAAGDRIDFATLELADLPSYAWAGEIDTIAVPGSFMTEYVFFHKPSRTLILTDLIENFEPAKVNSMLLSWLIKLSGIAHPHGSMPIDMRASYRPHLGEVKAALETMLDWHPERIIIAHGKCYDTNGEQELRRAFAWALK